MDENIFEKKGILFDIKEPSIKYRDSYLAALIEDGRNEQVMKIKDTFGNFIQHLKDKSSGINLNAGQVPETTYWIVDKDGYVGRVSLRHKLNEKLLGLGGHIGYEIRPSKRRLGYGEKALGLVLPKAKELGLEKVLVTCDSTNIASKKIIENNGGVLENEVNIGENMPKILRFWINLK